MTRSASQTFCQSLACVLPRFGDNLGGGAEALVKSIVEELAFENKTKARAVKRIEVWTTCAVDHRTWENFYPPGESVENGIIVRRFAVDSRNVSKFLEHEIAIAEGKPLDVAEQLEWLGESVNSRALYQHIAEHGAHFDVILFAPYLFATTFWGALIYPERSVIIPCLHNESYAYLGIFKFLFERVKGLIFNSAPEMELAQELYDFAGFREKSTVVGMGFLDSVNESSGSVQPLGVELPVNVQPPYLLYSGRKERGKNLDLLLDCYQQLKAANGVENLQLVLIGSGAIDFCPELPRDVLDLGFVSAEVKRLLMQNALALCQPSVNESFSIVIMEAWLEQIPVIVHRQCAVTYDHVIQSGGGLYFDNPEEFARVVQSLMRDSELRSKLGAAGANYVQEQYSWPAVQRRLMEAFRKLGISSDEQGEIGANAASI